MPTTIDSLQIQVESSAQNAQNGLDALTGSLEKLKNATKGGLGLTSVANQLGKLNQAVTKLTSLGATNLNATINALGGLRNLQGVKLSSTIARSIAEIGDAAGHLNAEGVVLLREFAPALSSLSAVQNVRISSNIGKQLGEITRAASSINTADLSKIAELSNAVSSLASITDIRISSSLANQIINLAIAAEQLQGQDLSIFGNLAEALHPLSNLGDMSNLLAVIRQLRKLPETAQQLSTMDTGRFAQQIQDIANALAPLASQMQSIANGFSALPARLRQLVSGTNQLTQANQAAGTSYMNLYARIRMAATAVRSIGTRIAKWINESNQYVENLNLFTASMGQYAEEAQRYAEKVGDLVGIDPSDWMRNQGVFMTLATGFGVAGDRAYTMSQNLTQLGYDLSSFFNIKVDDAMQKLQSGLSGELEPLRHLGYDLSQARLKAVALELGISKAFNSMTQAEKSQLRYYAIMTQVTTAQGDMARTLNAPANQIRVLQAQVTQAARALGNIFIPALNAVLPVCIAVAKAIRMVAAAIASLFGFSLPEIDYSGISAGVDNVADGAGALSDNLGKAGGNAKKLKNYLMGFDELNVIDPDSGGGGGGGSGGGGGGGSGSDWDWELPTYDFLDGLVSSRVDEIFAKFKPALDWIQDHLEGILAVAEAIGAELLLWKIATSLIPDLGTIRGDITKILGVAAALATIVVTVTLVYEFDKKFLKTGKPGFLVADLIASGLGAYLAGKIIEGSFQSVGAGLFTAGLTMTLSAGMSLIVQYEGISTEGINWKTVTLGIIAAGKTAIAGGIFAKSLGFSIKEGAFIGFTIGAALSAIVTFAGLVEKDDSSDWDKAVSSIVSVGTSAVAGAKLASSLGVSKLLGGGIGASVAAAIDVFVVAGKIAKDKGASWELAGTLLSGTIISAVSGALLAVGLGATLGSGVVIGAAAGLAISAIISIVGITDKTSLIRKTANWGNLALSADKIETVAKKLFTIDVTATINVNKATLTDEDTAREAINTVVNGLISSVNLITLGVTVDDSQGNLSTLKAQLLGDNGDGSGGIVGSIKTLLSSEQATLKLALAYDFDSLSKRTEEGNGEAKALYGVFGKSTSLIEQGVTDLAMRISDMLSDGISIDEVDVIKRLSESLVRINQALDTGSIYGQFYGNINDLFGNLTHESFDDALKQYQSYAKELKESYSSVFTQTRNDMIGNKHALDELAAQARRDEAEARKAGNEALADYYAAQAKEYELASANLQTQIDSYNPATLTANAMAEATSEAHAIIRQAFHDMFDDVLPTMVDTTVFTRQFVSEVQSGVFDQLSDNEQVESIATLLNKSLQDAMSSEDYSSMLNTIFTLNVDGWESMGEDAQKAFYDGLMNTDEGMQQLAVMTFGEMGTSAQRAFFDGVADQLGFEKTFKIFEQVGFDLSGMMKDGLLDGTYQVKDAGENFVLTFKDGTKVAIAKNNASLVKMFKDLGYDLVDGTVIGIDDEMTAQARALADLFGFPYEKAAEENEVHSPSQLFKRLGEYIVEGLIAGLGLLYTKLQTTWTTLPSWFQNIVNVIVSKFTGMNVDVGAIFSGTKTTVQNTWSGFPNWLGLNVTDPSEGRFSTLASGIISLLKGANDDTKTEWTGTPGWFSSVISSPIGKLFNVLTGGIFSGFKGANDDTKTEWTGTPGWFGTNIKNPIVALFTRLGFKTIGTDSATGLKEGLLSVELPVLSPIVNLVRNGWETVSGWVHGLFGNTSNDESVSLLKKGWTSVSSWVNGLFGNTKNDQSVGLAKSGWDTVSAWVNGLKGSTAVTKGIGLTQTSSWSSVGKWISDNYMGSSVTKDVGIKQGWGFTDIAKWLLSAAILGGTVTKEVTVKMSKDSSVTSLNDTLGITNWTRTVYVKMTKDSSVKSLNDTLGITNWVRTVTVKLAKQSGNSVTWNGKISGSGNSTKITLAKNGGIFDTGQMFIAREAGPELVGSIGGKTAVANNDQIVEAVSAGVYAAVSQAMGEGGGDGGHVIVNLDGKVIYENQQKIAQGRGYDLGMGAFSFG